MGISGLLKYTSNDLAVQIKKLRDWCSDPRGLLLGLPMVIKTISTKMPKIADFDFPNDAFLAKSCR